MTNLAYYTALAARAQAAASCTELKAIYTPNVSLITRTIDSVTLDLAGVQTDAINLEAAITTLIAQIATLTGSQSAATALTTLPGLAAGLVTLGDVIGFCHAQATIMASLGTANASSWLTQALALAKQLIVIQNDYTKLQAKIVALENEVSTLPTVLSQFTDSCQNASLKFTNCTL